MSVLGKMNLNEALRALLHFELSGASTGTPAYLVFSMEVEELARELSHSHSRGLGITAVPE
ncbi:hypothetical protein L917_15590 [Phytophthora nicotianae]|uniref:Uncharacterized protein n=1 Tax=Phytophthora nicotianae TaxID=4792 RepID=W2KHJ9_PHYNI|nr:hypothetical protein L917_15590 [Phytophthora nicotianae]